jgi:TDG/mug DNA glycosylase family protein
MFWYLLSDAGILKEERNELRDDDDLRRVYKEKFNAIYALGFINIINRPTRDITELKKGEELPAVEELHESSRLKILR